MVPFGSLLAHDNGSGVGLQFCEPQYQSSSWQDSPFSPKSRLDSRLDLSTFRVDSMLVHPEDDEFDNSAPYSQVMERTSYYSIALDECEKGCSSAPTTLPLSSLTADEASDGKQSLQITSRSKVSFSKQVECLEIESHDSFTDEEYDAMWYTPEESLQMRYDCVETVRVMAGQAPLEAQEVCFRGLECKTGQPLQARSSRKALTRKSVLEEQAFYRELRVSNEEAIAQISRQHSAPSVAFAIEVAQRDCAMDCDQWMYHYDEDEWTFSNEIVKEKSWLHAALPIAPKLNFFSVLRNPITV